MSQPTGQPVQVAPIESMRALLVRTQTYVARYQPPEHKAANLAAIHAGAEKLGAGHVPWVQSFLTRYPIEK